MNTRKHIACIHLGSNLGDRATQLQLAHDGLNRHLGGILAASRIYETAAWGYTAQPDFLNQALLLQTSLPPLLLLEALLALEQSMGRVRQKKWGPRRIDLDLIFYDDYVIRTVPLTLPHPRMQQRAFVLAPMLDICPDWRHPVLGQTLRELWGWCPDDSKVRVRNV